MPCCNSALSSFGSHQLTLLLGRLLTKQDLEQGATQAYWFLTRGKDMFYMSNQMDK